VWFTVWFSGAAAGAKLKMTVDGRGPRGGLPLLLLLRLGVWADNQHSMQYLPLIPDSKSVSLIGHGAFDPRSLVDEVFEAARVLNKTSELKLVVRGHHHTRALVLVGGTVCSCVRS
jgi:hypothetical protein